MTIAKKIGAVIAAIILAMAASADPEPLAPCKGTRLTNEVCISSSTN